MTVHIGQLRVRDAGELWTVQRAAYLTEAQRYQETRIPPLLETLDEVRADIESPVVVTLGAWDGPRLVGSARGRPDGDRMEVARVCVAPDQQGRGVGRALLTAIEDAAPSAVRTLWLIAGAASADNLRLYRKAGYAETSSMTDAVGIVLAVLEKSLSSAEFAEPRQ